MSRKSVFCLESEAETLVPFRQVQSSDVVLETKVLVSRRLEDKK